MRRSLLPLILTACLGQKDTVGGEDGYPVDESDGDADADTDTDLDVDQDDTGAGAVDATELGQSCDPSDAGPSELVVAVEGELASVTHAHVVMEDCGVWAMTIDVDGDTNDVDVEYVNDDAEGCEDTCGWTFTYEFQDLAPGDWTLNAAGDSASFTVPE
jgi:hypothetical protein